MADSGVDTGNESSDNTVFDHSHHAFEFKPLEMPLNLCTRPMSFEFGGERGHFGKIRGMLNSRSTRIRNRFAGPMYTSRNKHLRFAAATNNTSLVDKLLSYGADPNCYDEHRRSPLHLAACRGYIDVVKILLKYGANPNSKDTLGNTPLHLAACTNHIPVVVALLDAGTDVSTHDQNGRNPIQLAQSKLKLILMRPSGASHMEETKQLINELFLIVEMMLKYMKVRKTNATEIESVRVRLESVNTREQVDSEVQNLLDSLDCLKLQ